jgi:prefoldin subunit 2
LIDERDSLGVAVLERKQEVDEHNLVIKRLKQLDNAKQAWQLIGDVLVKRTVEDVLPELEKKRDNLSSLQRTLERQLETKIEEVTAYQQKYNIRKAGDAPGVRGEAGNRKQDEPLTAQQGVLVSRD